MQKLMERLVKRNAGDWKEPADLELCVTASLPKRVFFKHRSHNLVIYFISFTFIRVHKLLELSTVSLLYAF